MNPNSLECKHGVSNYKWCSQCCDKDSLYKRPEEKKRKRVVRAKRIAKKRKMMRSL